MNMEAFRGQVRTLLTQHRDAPPAGRTALVVPLKITTSDDAGVLMDLLRRVAASPALALASAAGLLRFELSVDPAALSGACCGACLQHGTSGCATSAAQAPQAESAVATPAPASPLLRGVITERDVLALPAGCTTVGLVPRSVLTPLARDVLRQRGITVHISKET